MARAYPAPDAFPGSASQPDHEPDNFDYDVPPDSAVAASITPGGNRVSDAGAQSAPNPFPGYPMSQPNGSSGGYNYPTSGGAADVGNAGVTVLSPPNAFPGGGQIPASPDTTGMNGQVPRLRRDNSAGGVMP